MAKRPVYKWSFDHPTAHQNYNCLQSNYWWEDLKTSRTSLQLKDKEGPQGEGWGRTESCVYFHITIHNTVYTIKDVQHFRKISKYEKLHGENVSIFIPQAAKATCKWSKYYIKWSKSYISYMLMKWRVYKCYVNSKLCFGAELELDSVRQ